MSTPILTTGRLILRPPVAGDARAIGEILNIWDVTKWLTLVPYPYGIADAEEFLARLSDRASQTYWLIETEAKVCGAISLLPDLGFFLAPDAQGKGIMTEAARAVLTWHFSVRGGDVVSGYHAGNLASARVQAKLGFVRTHEITQRKASTGESVTVIKTVLTPARWDALRNGGR